MPAPVELADLLKSVGQTNEIISEYLKHANDVPSSAPITEAVVKSLAGAGDGVSDVTNSLIQRRIMQAEQMEKVKDSLRNKSLRELMVLFAKQASRRDTGVPLYDWLYAGGRSLGDRFGGIDGQGGLTSQVTPDIAKAIDTNGVSALIRQDLEPILYEIFVKIFPLYDRIAGEPANGLVHAYNQTLSYGDAEWIGELDTVSDDKGVYQRQTANVGILATRRGVSLKSQFAVLAGGAGFNPERLELTAGLLAMKSRMQKTMLSGNWHDAGGSSTDEIGAYDADSFDGLRYLLNSASAVNVDPATDPDTTGSLRRAFDAAVQPIIDAGGGQMGLSMWGSTNEQITFDEQQDPKLRVINDARAEDVTVGIRATKVNTIAGVLPMFGIPGGQIGKYTATTYSSNQVRDVYILDESTITRPYLGTDGPTVLEIPIGVTGQLTHLFIIFMMSGFAVKVPSWNNKVRVKAA